MDNIDENLRDILLSYSRMTMHNNNITNDTKDIIHNPNYQLIMVNPTYSSDDAMLNKLVASAKWNYLGDILLNISKN